MRNKPNLYIGLVCAAGTDLAEIKQQLVGELSVVGYTIVEVKVSRAIAEFLALEVKLDEYERTIQLMNGGDKIRENSDKGSGVGSLVVTALRTLRNDDDSDRSIAYIIDSLKNPKEVEILDQLYGRNFYAISVYSPRAERRDFLANKIARSKKRPVESEHYDLADDIINRDQKGKKSTGQGVRDTFPKGDFFIDAGDEVLAIKRFVRLIFQDPFITPTLDEYMMFVAKATALRSCDLSRQVGAVIRDVHGAILATGCNEVPYPDGGFYFEGRDGKIGDNRDKEEKHDPNFNEVKRSISEFLDILGGAGLLREGQDAKNLPDELLHGMHKDLMAETRLRNIIEFSRVVHAEMQAITEAAKNGRSLHGSTLYCTTYPCHLCARHIISSGISQVVYIEPYPKSLTDSLYHREIASGSRESEGSALDPRVQFRSFRGVSPTLYQRVFSYRKRKDEYGAIARWVPEDAVPVGAVAKAVRPDFELFIANQIAQVLEKIHMDGDDALSDSSANHEGTNDAELGDTVADSKGS